MFWKGWKIDKSSECQEWGLAPDLVSGGSHCSFLIRREKWVGQDDLEKRDKSLLAKRPTARLCCNDLQHVTKNLSYYYLGNGGDRPADF